jgi:anti-anti-sigma factor
MTKYTVHHRFIHDIAVISVSGGCEDRCTEEVEKLFDHLIAEGYRRYIFDVTRLDYAESSGFRLLIHKTEDIQNLGGNLIVVGLSGRVERAFNLLKLRSYVPTAGDIKSALIELGELSPSKAGTGTYG